MNLVVSVITWLRAIPTFKWLNLSGIGRRLEGDWGTICRVYGGRLEGFLGILELNLSETSADSTFQRLGDWAIDSLSDRAATARVQDRPEVWQALLGDTFPSRVASHGLSFHVERQPYQVHRPRQLPMPAEPAAEVSRQVASHLQRGYIEVVSTESDDLFAVRRRTQLLGDCDRN